MKIKTKSKKLNKTWLHEHIMDPYVKMAKRDGYRARAAYKLIEIDEELKLFRPGQVVVDLGAAPGAWSQYLRRRFAPKEAGTGGAAVGKLNGTIIALDLVDCEPIEGVQFIRGDFQEQDILDQLEAALAGREVDVVVSDMAPNLSGIESSDAARVAGLVELAIEFAQRHLKPDGALVAKVFHGSGYTQLVEQFKATFKKVKPIKPKASKDRSTENFLVGIGLKTPR
ncbi:RlmE family RNA methyltransferase [Roseateles sp. GG27B]